MAICRFTELIQVEYGDKGVIAHAVHPGAIGTDMAYSMPIEMHHHIQDTLECASHGIVWLAKERREWLSGRYFSCQWDVDELLAKKEEIVNGDKLKLRMLV